MRAIRVISVVLGAVNLSALPVAAQTPQSGQNIIIRHAPTLPRAVIVYEAGNRSSSFEVKIERNLMVRPGTLLHYVKIDGISLEKSETLRLSKVMAESQWVKIESVRCVPNISDSSLCQFTLDFSAESESSASKKKLQCGWQFTLEKREKLICKH